MGRRRVLKSCNTAANRGAVPAFACQTSCDYFAEMR
jgi:hypothetical protein